MSFPSSSDRKVSAIPKLSVKQKEYLREATSRYESALPGSQAEEYLAQRGLLGPSVRSESAKFHLGYCNNPLPGHDMFRGMLAIPYLRWSPSSGASVVSIRFRCVASDCDHKANGHGKYMSAPGSHPRLFNTLPLQSGAETVAICEGEMDAITATVCGFPAVGVSGSEAWLDHFREPFLGFETVYLLADGDEPGTKLMGKLAKLLPNSKVITFEPGEDVNSSVLKYGKQALHWKVQD